MTAAVLPQVPCPVCTGTRWVSHGNACGACSVTGRVTPERAAQLAADAAAEAARRDQIEAGLAARARRVSAAAAAARLLLENQAAAQAARAAARVPCPACHGTRQLRGQPCALCGAAGLVTAEHAGRIRADIRHFAADPPATPLSQYGQAVLAQVLGFPNGTTDWLNILTFGAEPDPGATIDSAGPIQQALNRAAPGQVVYKPWGPFNLASTITIPPQVRLMGCHWPGIDTSLDALLPMPAFTGTTVVGLVDQATGGYLAESLGQSLVDINIDGSNCAATGLNALTATGLVHTVLLQRCTFYNVSNHGLQGVTNGSGNPHTWRLLNVTADTCGGPGFAPGQLTDSTWIDPQAINCGNITFAAGFFISGCQNSHFIGARSEFNNLYGIQISGAQGSGTGSGPLVFDGFSTDRNASHGIYINATGTIPVVFNSPQCRRDASSSPTGGAGILIDSATTCPVILNDVTTFPGVNDNGTGTLSPQYGINIIGTGFTQVNGAYLHAATAGLNGTPTNNRAVAVRAGSTASPGAITLIADSS
jgi:hypothetical protein